MSVTCKTELHSEKHVRHHPRPATCTTSAMHACTPCTHTFSEANTEADQRLTHTPIHLLSCSSHPLSPLPLRNRHSEAEPLYRQAVEQQQRVLGPEHPDTIMAISKLAACISATSRWASSDAAKCGWVEGCLHHLCGVCVGELGRQAGRQAAAGLSGPE